jgi:outer membrane usher protein
LACLLMVLGLLAPQDPQATGQQALESAPLTIVVNTEEKGTAIVWLRANDVLVQESDLANAGLQRLGGTREIIAGVSHVSLRSLVPDVAYEVDQEALALRLTVQPALLPTTTVQLRANRPADVLYTRDTSGFLNYSVNVQDCCGVDVFMEGGVSVRGSLVTTTATRTSTGHYTRGESNVVIDSRRRLQRWTFGDRFVAMDQLGGSVRLGGVTRSRRFDIDPYFSRYPVLNVRGAARTPAEVEVYANGALVHRGRLPAGPFDLRDLPVAHGAGAARVVIRDVYGREESIAVPYYFATTLLARGIGDYTYSLGFERQGSSGESWDYRMPVALASHRYGFSDALTAGFRAEARPDLVSVGGTLATGTTLGAFEVAFGASRTHGSPGAAGWLRYSYTGRMVGLNVLAERRSSRYATVGLAPSTVRETTRFGAGMSIRLGALGALSTEYRAARRGARADSDFVLGANVRVTPRVGVNISTVQPVASGTHAGRTVFASLNLGLSRTAATTVSLRHAHGSSGASIDVAKPTPLGNGWGYRVQSGVAADNGSRGQFTHSGPLGIYELQAAAGTGSSVSHRLAGSVIGAGGRAFLSRPVRDAFALIRIPGVRGVRGYVANQEIGRTDARGDLVVPALQSHYGNALRIDALDIPVNVLIDAAERVVAPPLRGGALVLFPVRGQVTVTGTIVVQRAGATVVPSYGELRIMLQDGRVDSPVSAQGEFYLEGVTAGRHRAEVEDAQGVCGFEIDVPAGKPIVDLGLQRCSAGD